MKRFLAVYTGTEATMGEWESLDEKTRDEREQEGMKAWMNWATKNEKSILEQGSPLGKTKLINRKGISETKNNLCAWTLVQAENHEAAAKLFSNHPHFMIFPGDAIELMECLPVPEM